MAYHTTGKLTSIILAVCVTCGLFASSQAESPDAPLTRDHEELARLCAEDQADRSAQAIDWEVVGQRDGVRLARVKELYAANQLATGADFYHAAMVLLHGWEAEDVLLAHELSVLAISKGEDRAVWLAAATEDRFLMKIGRPQRFGTQYQGDGDGTYKLYQVADGVTDAHRQQMRAPSLVEAGEREAMFERRE